MKSGKTEILDCETKIVARNKGYENWNFFFFQLQFQQNIEKMETRLHDFISSSFAFNCELC